MNNLTHLQGRITKVKFLERILENIYAGSEKGASARSRAETNKKIGS
jgi:hypothetical protein